MHSQSRFPFFQVSACTSINGEVYTKKYNIFQKSCFPFGEIACLLVLIVKHILINGISCKKSRFPFCKIAHLLVLMINHILINGISCKNVVFFLQDCVFTSTNKWNILQKSRFLFCKIAHLLVFIVKHILINGISCKKVLFFFVRFCIR